MPAFAADYFGPRSVGRIYGLMLTAWGVGAVVGPHLIAAVRESTGAYSRALYIIAAVMIVRPPRLEETRAVRQARHLKGI